MGRRWTPALLLGALWWWAVLRLVVAPDQAGAVEATVAAGGWGLSLLPVHVASVLPPGERGRAVGGGWAGRWRRSARAGRSRRSGGGSHPR
ncbi:hypothetical protein [Streptomyces pratensis]|uniref:hypothetical protein n=1 Tax=Streptomyces pratensis TaxID=1169025 RepID=UPI00301923E1